MDLLKFFIIASIFFLLLRYIAIKLFVIVDILSVTIDVSDIDNTIRYDYLSNSKLIEIVTNNLKDYCVESAKIELKNRARVNMILKELIKDIC